MTRKTEVYAKGIVITAADERGVAQGLYALEDRMNLRKAPFLKIGATEEKPLFSPRMIHSGYDMDIFLPRTGQYYQCDAECLQWRLCHMDYLLRVELPRYVQEDM